MLLEQRRVGEPGERLPLRWIRRDDQSFSVAEEGGAGNFTLHGGQQPQESPIEVECRAVASDAGVTKKVDLARIDGELIETLQQFSRVGRRGIAGPQVRRRRQS